MLTPISILALVLTLISILALVLTLINYSAHPGLARVDQAGHIITHTVLEWLLMVIIGIELHDLGPTLVIAVVKRSHPLS